MEDVVLEMPSKHDIACDIHSLAVSSAKLDLALVVVPVCVDKPSVAIRQSSCKGSLVVPSSRVVVSTESLRFAVVPLALIDDSSPKKFEVFVGNLDPSLTFEPAIALLLYRLQLIQPFGDLSGKHRPRGNVFPIFSIAKSFAGERARSQMVRVGVGIFLGVLLELLNS